MLVTYAQVNKELISIVTNGDAKDPGLTVRHKTEVDKYLQENEGAVVVGKETDRPVVLLDPNAVPELTDSIEARLKSAGVNVTKVNNSGIGGAFMSKDKVKGNKLALQYQRSLNKLKQQLQSPKPVNPEIEAWNKAVEEKRKAAKQAKMDKVLLDVVSESTLD